MFEIRLGTVTRPQTNTGSFHHRGPPGSGGTFAVAAENWYEHVLVLGRTGSGKSRLLNQIVRQHLEQRIGLLLIDPDSDLVEDVLAYAVRRDAETGNRRLLRRLHVLEPSPFLSFRYDPFHFALPRPVHPELLPSVRAAWLHCQVQRVAEVLQRNNGQFDFLGMPRLHRVLTSVLYGVGALVDGRHLSLADASVLLDVHGDAGRRAYRKVAHLLPRDVRADFEVLARMKRVEELRRETESCLNRLRTLFGPVVASVFAADGSEPAFNLFDAVQQGHVVLASLRDTPFFSGEQGKAVGNLLLYDAVTTAMLTPREMRKPLTVLIDEAAEYVSADLSTILRRGRKLRLSLVLAAQSLQSFQKDTLDLRPIVLGQPATVISLNQRWPDDLDLLARTLFTGRLDFTELMHEVERDGGVEWITQEEHSYSDQQGSTWSDSAGWQRGQTTTEQSSITEGEQAGWQRGRGRSVQTGGSRSLTVSRSDSDSQGEHESAQRTASDAIEKLTLASRQRSCQNGVAEGETVTDSLTESESESVSGGSSRAVQRGTAHGTSAGSSGSHSDGGSHNTGHSVAYRHAQVRRVVRELQRTGQLETSVADQLMRFAQKLFGLGRREAVALCGNEVVEFLTADVPDPFCSSQALVRAAEGVKRRLLELRPYLFVPDLTPEAADRRLESFLDGAISDSSSVPVVTVSADDPFA